MKLFKGTDTDIYLLENCLVIEFRDLNYFGRTLPYSHFYVIKLSEIKDIKSQGSMVVLKLEDSSEIKIKLIKVEEFINEVKRLMKMKVK